MYKKEIFYSFVGLFGLFVVLTLGTYAYFASDISNKERLMNRNNTGLTLMDRNDTVFFTFNQPKAIKYVTLTDIPQSIQDAAVAAEDKDFYKNPGFSLTGIGRAIIVDVTGGHLTQGGSTITQELVKNALLNSNKSFLRKYQELVLAVEIDRQYSKKDILELYLNSIYFGEGAFGIQNAAQTYFGEDSSQLDLAQSALLAGLIPAPSAYSPLSNDPSIAIRRQHVVLSSMAQQGFITQDEAITAENEKIVYAPPKKEDTINLVAPHFALYVKDYLTKKYGADEIVREGFRVTTTLNLDWQTYAENVVERQVAGLKYNDASNGAAVAIDPKTGQILVMVGSHDWSDTTNGKTNMALSPRQPGSSFKPIVYSDAIGQRLITPATVLDDKPLDINGYKPLDYDKQFRGQVTVRRALANSLNIPAVEVMQKIGVDEALSQAQKLGITTLGNDSSKYGLSLVLGAGEVPLLQMTDAYAVFADEGTYHDTTPILEVKNKYGDTVETYQEKSQDVMDNGVAYLISSILSDNKTRAEEFGNALTISRTAAVKTGTTENFRDALTIGYTPSLVVGVWVGNNDNTPMDNIAGSLGAAPIWRQMMEHMLTGTSLEKFTKPDDVVEKPVCPYGLPQPTQTNPDKNAPTPKPSFQTMYTEFFLTGTEPDKGCELPTETPKPSPSESPTPNPSTTPTPTQQPTYTPIPTYTPYPTPTTFQITIPPNPLSSPTPTP